MGSHFWLSLKMWCLFSLGCISKKICLTFLLKIDTSKSYTIVSFPFCQIFLIFLQIFSRKQYYEVHVGKAVVSLPFILISPFHFPITFIQKNQAALGIWHWQINIIKTCLKAVKILSLLLNLELANFISSNLS